MTIRTFSSREFNQDASKIKNASLEGPVFITDRGELAHVILAIQDYQKLTETKESIIDLLAMPESSDIEFEPKKVTKKLFKPEDFE